MATPTTINPNGGPATGPAGGGTGALPGLAAQTGTAAALAAKHTTPPKPGTTPPRNLGGRKSVEVEAREWLAKQGMVAVPAGQTAPALLEPLPAPADPALVKEIVRILLEGYSELRSNWLRGKVAGLKLGSELEKEAEKLAAVRPANAKVMVESSPLVLEKFGVSGEHLPVVAFLGAFATDLAQFAAAMRTFQQMAKDRELSIQQQRNEGAKEGDKKP